MTTDVGSLQDTLSKRIAHGTANARDLSLLRQLLVCQRRRWLLCGAAAGIGLAAALQTLAFMVQG